MAAAAGARLAGTVRIEPVDFADPLAVRACHEVHRAAHDADDPDGVPLSAGAFGGWLAVGWEGDPREAWAARDEAATVTGWYRLELTDRENLDRAHLTLVVHPARRRRGIGRALLRHAVARAAGNRRSVLGAEVFDGSAGESFARAAGARPVLTDIRRVQDLLALDRGALARASEQAGKAAAGYSVVSWAGPVPEEFLDGVAAAFTALGDAPRPGGSQPWAWDARRVRERHNDLLPRLGGQRVYSVAAWHRATGELAGLTQVWVDPAAGGQGFQGMTAVRREHRGHRLGLLVKVAMLELLARAEPQLERLETWNAADNAHMIAVNEALGYRVLGPPSRVWQLEVQS